MKGTVMTRKMQNRGKNANQAGQPKKRRSKCSRRKQQKQNDSNVRPVAKKENYSLHQSRHEIEREYLQEMYEMLKCEESNTAFDRTKLDRLTKLFEKLNEEDEDLKTGGTEQNTRKDDAGERNFKDKLDEDCTPTFNDKATHHENNTQKKLKLPINLVQYYIELIYI